MRIVCQKEMDEIKDLTEKKFSFGQNYLVENFSVNASNYLISEVIDKFEEQFELIFMIGKGNNGSEGLAIARQLRSKDYPVTAFLFYPVDECSDELKSQMKIAESFGVHIFNIDNTEKLSSFFQQSKNNVVVIDAIFGVSVRLPLSNFLYDCINYVNKNANYIISIDIPTGVEGDTGFVQGNAIKADQTLSVGLPKLGYYVSEGPKYCGSIKVLDVGFPHQAIEGGDKFLIEYEDIYYWDKIRSKFSDKKSFGHSLLIGGSHGLTGALVLAAKASQKVGAGLVTAATWENQYHEFIMRLTPDIMTGYVPLDTSKWDKLMSDLDKYDSIVIGPGLARSTRARKLVLDILAKFNGPIVIDADAINVLKVDEDATVFQMRKAPTVLTPHMGEFCRFSGDAIADVEREPIKYLKELIEKINCAVVLKGPCTYLGFPNGNIYFSFFPNDGMATGGVGDVLAGIMGGLVAQEKKFKDQGSLLSIYDEFDKLIAMSVVIHSLAGKMAVAEQGARSMSASSLVDFLPQTFKEIDNK